MVSYSRYLVVMIIVLSALFSLCGVDGTLSKSDKKDKKAKKKSSQKNMDPVPNVMSRDLIKSEHRPSDILKEHSRYCELEREVRHFKGPVLAYVTPWNSKGYDIAKMFHKKFTLVSPVWLQVKPKQNHKYAITGSHDIDKDWVVEVTRGGDNSLVPRVLFDGWTVTDYKSMYASEQTMLRCAKAISTFIKKHGFGGVTIEVWSQTLPSMQSDLTHFLVHLSDLLHADNKILILVVPPTNVAPSIGTPQFTKINFEELKSSVDYFSVMTYDYHVQAGVAAPISPIEWIERSLRNICPQNNSEDRAKLLLGIHFYGIKFGHYTGAAPVIGHEFITTLKNLNVEVKWQPTDAEHSYIYQEGDSGEEFFLFYPSLLFLKARLDLARKLGTGIAIWEIGQGLDYFYDLL